MAVAYSLAMESQYVYQKKRADFGRHANFTDRLAELHIDIEPDESCREVSHFFENLWFRIKMSNIQISFTSKLLNSNLTQKTVFKNPQYDKK